LGVQLHVLEARSPDDLKRVFAALPREGANALFAISDALLLDRYRANIAALALQSRLPTMYNGRMSVEAGGLMAYGPSQPEMHYRAAYYVDRLLKGTPPADLPVEQPRKFELVLNLKTAQTLGITFPPTLLILADEVIK
jgi:putative ABC transport system substrate-binding protein